MTETDRTYLARNDAARDRLTRLVARLGEDDLARPVGPGDGWTVAALLAHLAFWDRFVLARWERRLRDGGPIAPLDDGLLDLVNAAGLPQWLALPTADAGRQAVDAATVLDRRIADLPSTIAAEARRLGFDRMLDRSGHRRDHLDDIERALSA